VLTIKAIDQNPYGSKDVLQIEEVADPLFKRKVTGIYWIT
jgi:hypothetical protein